MTISADLFREVFRRWPSGAAVVTSCTGGRPHGMVVGSFCSLSLEPPLVMVSAGTATKMHDIIDRQGLFAVSILSHEQVAIFDRFAGFDRNFDHDRFAGLTTTTAVTGMPVLPDALAWVDCRVVDRHLGRGYTIFVGEVVAAALGEAAEDSPLIYFRRRPSSVAALGERPAERSAYRALDGGASYVEAVEPPQP
jgi:flavin reductase (DIM6/NTAB) family NADH-FMN oxidoreductase RutF